MSDSSEAAEKVLRERVLPFFAKLVDWNPAADAVHDPEKLYKAPVKVAINIPGS